MRLCVSAAHAHVAICAAYTQHAVFFYCLHIFHNFSCLGAIGRPNILHRKFSSTAQPGEFATQETIRRHTHTHRMARTNTDTHRAGWKRKSETESYISSANENFHFNTFSNKSHSHSVVWVFFIYLFNYFLPKHIRHLFYHPSSYKSSSYQSPWMALCLWPLHRANGKSNFAKRLKLIAHLRDACPIKWIQFIRGDLSLLHKFIFTSAVIDEDRYDYSICSKCARLTAVFVFTKGLCLPRSLSVALALWINWHVCECEWRHNRDLLVFVCRQVVCVCVVSVSWVPLSWRIFCGLEYLVVLVLDLRQWQTTGQPQEFAVGSFCYKCMFLELSHTKKLVRNQGLYYSVFTWFLFWVSI